MPNISIKFDNEIDEEWYEDWADEPGKVVLRKAKLRCLPAEHSPYMAECYAKGAELVVEVWWPEYSNDQLFCTSTAPENCGRVQGVVWLATVGTLCPEHEIEVIDPPYTL